ncbi:phage tail protein [Paenibacillus phocaensis]|uniref:phage tail protein n=1 Tax=Paenibacillus phocaensis TaxID=1776378 RepID=UPI000839CDEE|nr:phage tail protein [Paenibacillus phocaensis]
MATNTPNLNLLKKDPVADGNETFNIQTMLNENWDKIDAAVGEVREELQDIDIPPASLTGPGIVQLSNSTSGNREDVAATENAVKATFDTATAAQTTANAANLAAAAAQTKADQAFQLGNERKQDVVDALIALGVSASMTDSWDILTSKMSTVIKATGNAGTEDVLVGKTFSSASASSLMGTMPNQGAKTYTINTQGGQYTIPAGYHNGGGKITASFANLVTENIKSGVNVGGVIGSLALGGYGELNTSYSGQAPNSSIYINVFDFPPGIKYFSISPEGLSYLNYAYKYGTPRMALFLAPEPDLSKSIFTFLSISSTPDASFTVCGLFVNLIQGIAYISGYENYSNNIVYRPIRKNSNYDSSKPQKLMVYLSQDDGGNPYTVNIKGKLLYC